MILEGAQLHQRERDPMAGKRRSTNRERYHVLKEMLAERRTEVKDKLRSLRETLPG